MNASLYVNFATAAVTFILGLLLSAGLIFKDGADSTRIMFGTVLMIYGVYRFITSVSKIKQSKLEERRLIIEKEKEKLLNK